MCSDSICNDGAGPSSDGMVSMSTEGIESWDGSDVTPARRSSGSNGSRA
jgi:hypothetical protein